MYEALDNFKGKDIVTLDVSTITDFTDCMIIASGTSNTHVRALVRGVVDAARDVGRTPIGVEGEAVGEWVLVDLGELIVHVMQASTRDYYDLERLWGSGPVALQRAAGQSLRRSGSAELTAPVRETTGAAVMRH